MLTRAGYAGIQRYAAVWTGDNRSFWEHMAMAIPMVLNMGLSGLAFAGPDIGGLPTIHRHNYWYGGRRWGCSSRTAVTIPRLVHCARSLGRSVQKSRDFA